MAIKASIIYRIRNLHSRIIQNRSWIGITQCSRHNWWVSHTLSNSSRRLSTNLGTSGELIKTLLLSNTGICCCRTWKHSSTCWCKSTPRTQLNITIWCKSPIIPGCGPTIFRLSKKGIEPIIRQSTIVLAKTVIKKGMIINNRWGLCMLTISISISKSRLSQFMGWTQICLSIWISKMMGWKAWWLTRGWQIWGLKLLRN